MNDKTVQALTDDLRLVARSLHAQAGLSGWGNLCSEAADTIDNLRAEKDRLMTCLEKANISTEHFEREWYLRGDELDNLRAQLAEARRNAERWDRAAHCVRLDQFGGFVVTPDEPALDSDVSLAFTREIDASIDAARGEKNGA